MTSCAFDRCLVYLLPWQSSFGYWKELQTTLLFFEPMVLSSDPELEEEVTILLSSPDCGRCR